MSEVDNAGNAAKLTPEEAADRRAAYEAQRREWSEAWRASEAEWRAGRCEPELS